MTSHQINKLEMLYIFGGRIGACNHGDIVQQECYKIEYTAVIFMGDRERGIGMYHLYQNGRLGRINDVARSLSKCQSAGSYVKVFLELYCKV